MRKLIFELLPKYYTKMLALLACIKLSQHNAIIFNFPRDFYAVQYVAKLFCVEALSYFFINVLSKIPVFRYPGTWNSHSTHKNLKQNVLLYKVASKTKLYIFTHHTIILPAATRIAAQCLPLHRYHYSKS
jgi:hypothetical protein